LTAVVALLTAPVGASAHPKTLSSLERAGMAASFLTHPPDDGGANFQTSRTMRPRHLNAQTQEFTISEKRDDDRWDPDDWHGDDDDRGERPRLTRSSPAYRTRGGLRAALITLSGGEPHPPTTLTSHARFRFSRADRGDGLPG
jgi:hypothetical protein